MRHRSQTYNAVGRSAFTLIEVMTTVALVAMAYGLVAGTTISLARYSKTARIYAQRRADLIQISEQLRWQLRSLVVTPDSIGLDGRRGGEDGDDQLRFMTHRGRSHRGVVEVGYKVDVLRDPEREAAKALYYREFRLRGPDGLHPIDDFDEGKWTELSSEIAGMDIEYSLSGVAWQKEWDAAIPPSIIKVKLTTSAGEEIEFQVIPGLGARRW